MQHWPWEVNVIRGVLRVFHGVDLVAVENYEFKWVAAN